MDEQIFTQRHKLYSPQVDLYGRWRPADIFLVMQELAGEHSLQLGCHMKDLMPRGITWVISRIQVQMQAYPRLGEEVVLKTWAGSVQRMIFPRHFIFERPDGTFLGAAHTLWLLLDLNKRRMVGASALNTDSYPKSSDLPVPVPAPQKLTVHPDMPCVAQRRAAYSDMDINRHMNNTRYIEWLCDLFPAQSYEERALSALTVNYTHEIPPETQVDLYLAQTEAGFDAAGLNVEQPCFVASGTWGLGL